MKIRLSRIVLMSIGAVLVAALLPAYIFHARGKRALERYCGQLQASGEKLTVSQMRPRSIPPDQNSLNIFQTANRLAGMYRFFDTNAPTPMRSLNPGKAIVAWAQPDVRGEKTNTWEECQAAALQEKELVELLETIVDRPAFDFHLDYDEGFSLLLPHLAPLKRCAQHLSISAICDLQRGDAANATEKIRAMLAIAKSMGNERLIISQLVRIAIANIAVAVTWELLQSPKATDEELAQLQREWAGADFVEGGENAVLMERAMCESIMARMHQSSAEFRRQATMFSRNNSTDWLERAANSALLKTKESMWRFAWSDADELQMLRGQQVILEAFRTVRTNHVFGKTLREEESRLAELGLPARKSDSDNGLSNVEDIDISNMMSKSVLSIHRFPQRIFKIEVARQIAIGAIALKRYRLQHGMYPAQLSEMTPEILSAVPYDPADAKPLRYRVNSDGTFVLYSIGDDEKDDGGDPQPVVASKSATWLQGRDWVWPQPASEDEVRFYYEKEAATRAGSRVLIEFEKRYGLDATNHQFRSTNYSRPITNH